MVRIFTSNPASRVIDWITSAACCESGSFVAVSTMATGSATPACLSSACARATSRAGETISFTYIGEDGGLACAVGENAPLKTTSTSAFLSIASSNARRTSALCPATDFAAGPLPVLKVMPV